MKINFDELISAAQDYMDYSFRFSRKYPNGGYITCANPELCEAYRWLDRAERALTVVCYVTGIPAAVLIQAARFCNRFYEQAYAQDRDPGCIDAEQLIMALLANT